MVISHINFVYRFSISFLSINLFVGFFVCLFVGLFVGFGFGFNFGFVVFFLGPWAQGPGPPKFFSWAWWYFCN